MAFQKSPAARRFIATLAATASALALMTAAAIPARADRQSDDFAKALAAIAAIAIVGSAITDGKDDQRTTVQHNPRFNQTPRGYRHRYAEPQRQRRETVLPERCAIEVRSRRNTLVAYTERCLRRAGIDQRLPRQCEVSVGRHGRDRTAYDQNCLLHSGFRTQRRSRY